MKYLSIFLLVSTFISTPALTHRGRSASRERIRVENRDFLEVPRSRSRSRSMSRVRELITLRDNLEAEDATRCIDLAKAIVQLIATIIKPIVESIRS